MLDAPPTEPGTLALLREGVRQWTAKEQPACPGHEAGREDYRRRWIDMAALGWAGVTVPEEAGGSGMDLGAYCVIAEELGRELVASPLLSTGLLAPSLLARGRSDLLGSVARGETIVALALRAEAHGGAGARAGGGRLTARRRYVLEAPVADWFIVSVDIGEPALFLLPSNMVDIVALDTIDGRMIGHVNVDAGVTADFRLDVSAEALSQVEDLARIGLAAEMIGAAGRALELTLDYLRTREQFGRPIGSFQALQHRAARMLVDVELARACLHQAHEPVGPSGVEFAQAAALAKFMAGKALHRISNEMVQMHGGIGMTAEHLAGRYLKWARASEALYGGAAELASRYADLHGY